MYQEQQILQQSIDLGDQTRQELDYEEDEFIEFSLRRQQSLSHYQPRKFIRISTNNKKKSIRKIKTN